MKHVDEKERLYAGAVTQRIVQEALNQLSQFIGEGTVPGGPIFVSRGVTAVQSLAAAAGAQIGGLCANQADLAAGVKSAGKVMLGSALQELGRRTGAVYAMQDADDAPPASEEQLRQRLAALQALVGELREAIDTGAAALRSASEVMLAVPPLLHTHSDRHLARLGALVTELGVERSVRNAQTLMMAAAAAAAHATKEI